MKVLVGNPTKYTMRHIAATGYNYTYTVENASYKQHAEPERMRELCHCNTKCEQCKTIICRIRSLLDELDLICVWPECNDHVIGHCEYWKQSSQCTRCPRCNYILKRCISSYQYKYQDRQNRFRIWLCRVRHLLQALIEGKSVCQHNVYKDKEFEKLIHILKRHQNLDFDQFLRPKRISSLQSISQNKQIIEDILANIKNTENTCRCEDTVISEVCICPPPSETCVCKSIKEKSRGKQSSQLDTTTFLPRGHFQSNDGSEKRYDSKEPTFLEDDLYFKDRNLRAGKDEQFVNETTSSIKDAFKGIHDIKKESTFLKRKTPLQALETDEEKTKIYLPKEDMKQKPLQETRDTSKDKTKKELLEEDKQQKSLRESKIDKDTIKHGSPYLKPKYPSSLYIDKDKTKKHVPKEAIGEKLAKDIIDKKGKKMLREDKGQALSIHTKSDKDKAKKGLAKEDAGQKGIMDRIKKEVLKEDKRQRPLTEPRREATKTDKDKTKKDVPKEHAGQKTTKDITDKMIKDIVKEDKRQRPLSEPIKVQTKSDNDKTKQDMAKKDEGRQTTKGIKNQMNKVMQEGDKRRRPLSEQIKDHRSTGKGKTKQVIPKEDGEQKITKDIFDQMKIRVRKDDKMPLNKPKQVDIKTYKDKVKQVMPQEDGGQKTTKDFMDKIKEKVREGDKRQRPIGEPKQVHTNTVTDKTEKGVLKEENRRQRPLSEQNAEVTRDEYEKQKIKQMSLKTDNDKQVPKDAGQKLPKDLRDRIETVDRIRDKRQRPSSEPEATRAKYEKQKMKQLPLKKYVSDAGDKLTKDLMNKIKKEEQKKDKKERPLSEPKPSTPQSTEKLEMPPIKERFLKQLKADISQYTSSVKGKTSSLEHKHKQNKESELKLPRKGILESSVRKAWRDRFFPGKEIGEIDSDKKQSVKKWPRLQLPESKLPNDQLDFILGLLMEYKKDAGKKYKVLRKDRSKKVEEQHIKVKQEQKQDIIGLPNQEEDLGSAVIECDNTSRYQWPHHIMIKGNDVVPFVPYKEEEPPKEVEAEIFKTYIQFPETSVFDNPENQYNLAPVHTKTEYKNKQTPIEYKGITRYRLSDRAFVEKGWTKLPQKKVLRKMNIYRMYPAHPEYDWFERHKNDRVYYDNNENNYLLADVDGDGLGHWYYPNGEVALGCYETEESNLIGKIYVIYSSAAEVINGKVIPRTILGVFDFLGNGIVYDHYGNIRLKYNQTEGIIIDPKVSPPSKWKWHGLNDPPVLREVLVDPVMKQPDPGIKHLIEEYGLEINNHKKDDNLNMLAIEFDRYVTEKQREMTQKYEPYHIRIKAVKINKNFALRILDQSTIFLSFRDLKNKTSLKLNLGLLPVSDEIVDIKVAELDEIETPYD